MSTPRVPRGRRSLAAAFTAFALSVALSACGGGEPPASTATVYQGARLIVGDGTVVEDAAFVVDQGRFVQVGPADQVDVPAGAATVDLSGRTVMPALVNAHVHLANDRDERVSQLQHMAYYGAGAVVSLGHDLAGPGLAMRHEAVPDGARSLSAGQGITRPEPGRSEVPFWVDDEEGARSAVRELAAQDVDIVKIWVDDRGGRYEKLTEPLYSAIIDEAHRNGLKVTAHIFTLEDARGLLRAGVDAFAHGIRDRDVDDELVALWLERPEVALVPNLPDPGLPRDLGWLAATVPPDRLAEMQERASAPNPEARERFAVQARNLARLHTEGVFIAFGTDGSAPWAVHQELADMVRAGMPPGDALVAATGNAARLMGLDDAGTVAPGLRADFLVLGGNPLDDITHTRDLEAVYLEGVAVDREAVAARLTGGAG